MLPKKLQNKLDQRVKDNAFRQLPKPLNLIDFSSNDYLGFSSSENIFRNTHQYLDEHNLIQNDATGSRLLSGNHILYPIIEEQLSTFHNSNTALIFNSGFDANLGLLSCVPQRHDIVLFDEFCHASIRDGISMSNAKAYKFEHNNLKHLESQFLKIQESTSPDSQSQIYVVTESVFSMDADSPDLECLVKLCDKHDIKLIIDEAHAVGVIGDLGKGLVSQFGLEKHIFARVITFGKALGSHGAAILCAQHLKDYLINFSRPLIYTTGLPPHSLATIQSAYNELNSTIRIEKLHQNISYFKSKLSELQLNNYFIESNSAIHCCVISGNKKTKTIAQQFQDNGYDIKAILAPTVSEGKERLRFCIHAYNTEKEISEVLRLLSTFV